MENNEKSVKNGSVEDLKFDDKNFNLHSEFGLGAIEKSLRKNGAGRSILVDMDNTLSQAMELPRRRLTLE